jgi:hypothetical protein
MIGIFLIVPTAHILAPHVQMLKNAVHVKRCLHIQNQMGHVLTNAIPLLKFGIQ